ncbi:twin-arginine translocase TatA/TatE family subunit [Leucobacter chironomi]|uniref:twin-arginine translocase TatA/TatE family subunit n=1 Tax=Leucobacter chironomi TaxID=491918 RepID=UPI0004284A8C|nr:twin-arginine translocase TatA/TatE family subunit [Leucobacter chironomi]
MLGNLNGPTLVVILFIVLLLFGAPKLPGLAKSLGQSMRILKKEVRNDDAEAGTAKRSDVAPEAPSSEAGRTDTARPESRETGDGAPGDKP